MSDRLRTMADMVPAGSVVADIGTDHGILPEMLLDEGRASKVICCDISAASLDKARNRLSGRPNADFRCGDGLEPIWPGEAEIIVMSGLGGSTIMDILKKNPPHNERLILGAQSGLPALRRFLMENGYAIETEAIAKEGHRYYVIMGIRRGEMTLDEKQILMGRFLPDRAYLNHLCRVIEKGAEYDEEKRRALRLVEEALDEDS